MGSMLLIQTRYNLPFLGCKSGLRKSGTASCALTSALQILRAMLCRTLVDKQAAVRSGGQ